MARIRIINIENFRCIQQLTWFPSQGLNCLIGPGDSGKSSILDAIDLCLGARRNTSMTDADFHGLDVERSISISITLGELDDGLKSLEAYAPYLRSFNPATGVVADEPHAGHETVLTINVTVGGDLDPIWSLLSGREDLREQKRFLTWSDRARISPNRIGALADHNLAWRRGSVLNKLTEERADTAAALAKAARDARLAFGDAAEAQLGTTLQIVTQTANELGIVTGGPLRAMLDAHSVSFTGGTIALHGQDGVPLRALGVGSTRLLLSGLQRKAAANASVILIDELEYGLEPHRILRLLGSLGAKEQQPPLQGFITTHSPVAIRELSGTQLVVVRKTDGSHTATFVGTQNEIQGTIRSFPEAFLAPSVLVCEGATEVGLIRGLDIHTTAMGQISLHASGVSLVDANGVTRLYNRAGPFRALNYRVAVLRDDDEQPDVGLETSFQFGGGTLFKWRTGRALEDELFQCLPDQAVLGLLTKAEEFLGPELIDGQIKSMSGNLLNLASCKTAVTPQSRSVMALAAKTKQNPWFKTVSRAEEIGRDIVAPYLHQSEPGFLAIINDIWKWLQSGS
ncbi:AAA family ATPase [Bradyrhizobium sp. 2]|uniref:ATP-dependent nuclease n=1 Tax=Bradyrhizobium sp. 2 TaxID=190045 RepID=UPI001FF78E4F|nr:ATP-binding protein [Bradyrhizobium sp. 2]MCK1463087.1 AAA family ATPase [Bradyrhizobium sp. 2]